jgi:DNA-binding NarL/FixJ family response regulator
VLLDTPTYTRPECPALESTTDLLVACELSLMGEAITALCNLIPGFRVISQVGTGTAALAEMERLDPDLALIDMSLSDLLATELVRMAREKGFRTRCAILSMYKDRKRVSEAMRVGACGYILKSASSLELAEALRQLAHSGIYISPQIDVMSLFDEPPKTANEDPIEQLSSREFQVFSLLVEGVRAKEIAARLRLSPKTVDTYRSSLMRKLDIHDVAGLVKYAIKREISELSA